MRTENQIAAKQAALNSSYVGRPFSDLMLRNGVTPDDAFDMPGGQRVFILGFGCPSWWYTRRAGNTGTPADFIVERVELKGLCPS